MYPFAKRWQWLLKNRFKHYTQATQEHLDLFPEPYRTILRSRASSMERWGTIRGVVFILMNIGALSVIAVTAIRFLPAISAEAEEVLQLTLQWIGSFTALFAILFFVAMRILGQLEADLVSAMAVGGLEVARSNHPHEPQ